MKKISTIILSIFSIYSVVACDICGCYMGITPYKNFSSVGAFYRYRSFNGYPIANQKPDFFPTTTFRSSQTAHGSIPITPSDNIDSIYPKKDYEVYRTYELRAKYFIHKRVELNAIVPYYSNSSKEQGIRTALEGFGDISIFGGFHLIRKQDAPIWKNRLILGTGIKMSTGKYTLAGTDNYRFDALLQPGTGSNDWLIYTNYLLGYKNIGLGTNLLYKVNGTNAYDERIGNSVTTSANLFYILKKNNFQAIPSLQFYQEYTSGLYQNKEIVTGTKMAEIMLGPGLDLLYKGFILTTAFQLPAYSASGQTNLTSAGRMILGVSYTVLQKKYLLK